MVQDLLVQGGSIAWILFFLAVVSIGVFIERFLSISKEKKQLNFLLMSIKPLIEKGEIESALDKIEETPTVCSKVLFELLNKESDKKQILKGVLEESASIEMPSIWKNLNVLSVIVTISPLLGLLGTVVGMLISFHEIEQVANAVGGGYGPGVIAGGIKKALVTTILGLIVSIPSYIGLSYLSSQIEKLSNLLERSAYDLIDLMIGVKKIRK